MCKALIGGIGVIALVAMCLGFSPGTVSQRSEDSLIDVQVLVFRVGELKNAEVRPPMFTAGWINVKSGGPAKSPFEGSQEDPAHGLKHTIRIGCRDLAFPLTTDVSYRFESSKGLERQLNSVPKDVVIEKDGVVFEKPSDARMIASSDGYYVLILRFSPSRSQAASTAPKTDSGSGTSLKQEHS